MTAGARELPLLDEAQGAFIAGPVVINAASCNAEHVPSVVRAHGCRLSADRRYVTVFVSIARAAPVLDDLRAGGAIAVVVSRPGTHETLQLKGAAARIVPLEEGDPARIKAYAESIIKEICPLGYRESLVRGLVSSAQDASVGLLFEPTSAFVQTPGPKAGQRLEPKS